MRTITALTLTLATATTLFESTAQAAPSGPGCFPELNWTEPFVPAVLDPNSHLFEGEWKVVANGRLHTLEVLEVDAAAGWFSAYYNGELIQGAWYEDERKAEFYRTHPDGRGGITYQTFVGYVMDVNPEDDKVRMAGTVTREAPPVTTYDHPDRLTYGFYATFAR